MEGRLYTGRIYDYKKLRVEYPKVLQVCVMRWPPKFINLKNNKILHYVGLAPPIKMLKYYQKSKKTDSDWKDFAERFVKYIKRDETARRDRFSIRHLLLAGTQIVLLCHERIDERCHRQLLPRLLLTEEEIEEGVYQGELCFDATVQLKLDW